jgi:hypothetical protein
MIDIQMFYYFVNYFSIGVLALWFSIASLRMYFKMSIAGKIKKITEKENRYIQAHKLMMQNGDLKDFGPEVQDPYDLG